MRLFIAFDLPKKVKDMLFLLKDTRLTGARWTSLEQWHITLHFIGETDSERVIKDALHEVTVEAFEMRLRGVGTFPEKGKPKTLWAGIDAPTELAALHQAIGNCLKHIGFQPETRAYSPHMTLARMNEQAPSIAEMNRYREQFADFETDLFKVNEFKLYLSDLQRSGAVYSVRETYPLISG